ncbi:MAG: hypothetical protein KBS98_02950, partial [Flavobacterium sp.]|nr:hypothetical protein [Candidatus Neoflavobacterium equi]
MEIKTSHNSTFAIGGVWHSAHSFVVKESAVLRMNICVENPAHRKSAERYVQYYQNFLKKNLAMNDNIRNFLLKICPEILE